MIMSKIVSLCAPIPFEKNVNETTTSLVVTISSSWKPPGLQAVYQSTNQQTSCWGSMKTRKIRRQATTSPRCFETNQELYEAVRKYQNGTLEEGVYGPTISYWCVSKVTDMTRLFAGLRWKNVSMGFVSSYRHEFNVLRKLAFQRRPVPVGCVSRHYLCLDVQWSICFQPQCRFLEYIVCC